jgi:hypothetical protein
MKPSNRMKLREHMAHGAHRNPSLHRVLMSQIVRPACGFQSDCARAKKTNPNTAKVRIQNLSWVAAAAMSVQICGQLSALAWAGDRPSRRLANGGHP